VRVTGLNGTDGGSFAAVWRNADTKANEGAVFNARGQKLKSLSLSGLSMPSIAPLSLSGFVVVTRATSASKATIVKATVFANNGSQLYEIAPTFAKINVRAQPRVDGISENRYVITVLDPFNSLYAGVFWNDEQLFIYRVVESVDSWKVVALSGDSYCIVVRGRDDSVRSLCYRANSETQYLYDAAELQGFISKQSDAFTAVALPNNNFVVAVYNTPNISLSTFNFKDARELRDDGQQGRIRVTSPQIRINTVVVTQAAEAPVIVRRPNGFALAFEGADRSQKLAVFRNLGTTPPVVYTAEKGPIAGAGRVSGLPDNGVAVSYRKADGTIGIKWLKPNDFGEVQAQPQSTTAGKKRQAPTDTPAASAPATSAPATSAPATSAPATSAPATSAPATSAPATSAPATTAPGTTPAASAGTTTVAAAAAAGGAAEAPILVTLANGNVVAVTLEAPTGEAPAGDDDDDDDDDDADAKYNAKFVVYTPEGTVVAQGDLATNIGGVSLDDPFGARTSASSLSIALMSLLAAFVAALLL
jgi:hypothetical protein